MESFLSETQRVGVDQLGRALSLWGKFARPEFRATSRLKQRITRGGLRNEEA